MERTAAAILVKFEGMWSTFLKGKGSFDPFMDLYLRRWLHSSVVFFRQPLSSLIFFFFLGRDQLVTLTTTVPHQMVRIAGITPDHGLLRTLPERSGWPSGASSGFIDLQPDGNSFDLMAGLIKSK
jgi:biotin--protein ligase